MALTEVFKGTSEARRNRRVEEGNMRQEMLQQEKLDFQNAEMIGAEQASIETSRTAYLEQIQKIPHMRDYVNNYFDEKSIEFKGVIKSFNGRYSTAMSSGKVLDFRDGLMKNLKKSDKYQSGLASANNLANFDARYNSKETQDLISGLDAKNKRKFLAGEIESFQLGPLRAKYSEVDAADYYEGERPNFDKIFSSEYSSIVHNWAVEKGDPNQEKLAALAEDTFPGDPNAKDKYLKSWARGDMGMNGGYDQKMIGTKEADPVASASRFRDVFNQKARGGNANAMGMLAHIAGQPVLNTFGVKLGGPAQKGRVKIGGYQVFTDAPTAVLKVVQKQFGGSMKDNSDGTFDFEHVKGAFDADGVYMDDSDGQDFHSNMTYAGAHMVSKATFRFPDGKGGYGLKEQIMGVSDDRDLAASIAKEWGIKQEDITYVPTMVATFDHDGKFGLGFDDMRFWDKQVMVEMDPTGINLESMVNNTGMEEDIQESAKGSQQLAKQAQASEQDLTENLNAIRAQQQKTGNAFYKGTGGGVAKDSTMDSVDRAFSTVFDIEMEDAKDSKGIIYSIASVAAKNHKGEFVDTSKKYIVAMNKLLNGTDPNSAKFQDAVESKNPESIYDVMNSMFGDIGDKDEILKLAEIWSNYN